MIKSFLVSMNDSSSLFRHLLSEGVIYENRSFSRTSPEPFEVVQFSFERFADHLIANHILSKFSDGASLRAAFTDGALKDLVSDCWDASRSRGLLEALAVQVPDRMGRELLGLVPELADVQTCINAFLESIVWRDVKAISDETREVMNALLSKYDIESHVFRRLLLLSASPEHPWNARFLHRNLIRRSMVDRDATWSIFVFGEHGQHGPVDRMIDWGWSDEDKSHLDDESVELASIALAWLFTTSHRFVRDRATKALVALLAGRAGVLSRVLRLFEQVNDPYVLERLLAVACGCAMRTKQKEALSELARTTFDIVFATGKATPHILIRDYARDVIETAVARGCSLDFDLKLARPPYTSEWVPPEFKEGELEHWKAWSKDMPDEEWGRVHLYDSIMGSEDFARYVIGTNFAHSPWMRHRLRNRSVVRRRKFAQTRRLYEDEFDLRVAQSWVMRRVIDMGWTPGRFGQFDRRASRGHGREDHKPERVGKKYQWIAYHELLAHISDNFVFANRWDKSVQKFDGIWQVGFVRDIDPSCLIQRTATETEVPAWWQPTHYDAWATDKPDAEWVAADNDLLDPSLAIRVVDPTSQEWLVLESHFSFDQPSLAEDDDSPKLSRQLWYQIRSYFVPKRRLKMFFEWAKQQDFMDRWMPECHESSELFLGEYYWSPAYRYLQQPYYQRELWSKVVRGGQKLPALVAPTVDGYAHSKGLDCSIDETVRVILPSQVLVDGLNLQWNGVPGQYTDSGGSLIAYDPSVSDPGPLAEVVRADALKHFLEEHDLRIVWTLLAEKNVLTRDWDAWPGRLEISGAYSLSGPDLVGGFHTRFVGRSSDVDKG